MEHVGMQRCIKRAVPALAVCCAAVLLAGGCKKSSWLPGRWLLVSQEGKPDACHEFFADRTFSVWAGTECKGEPDPLLSGKWQLKDETQLAILRGTEEEAQLALVSGRGEDHFVVSGAISGKMFRLGKKSAAELVTGLESKGEIKLRRLPAEQGCQQLSMALKQIKALPKEPKPRMIRQRDQGLEYHVAAAEGDPRVEKVVFALNQDVIEWVAFHIKPEALASPGPAGRLQATLGPPQDTITTGSGEKTQQISMWRAYCDRVRGARNKDVDATLFATPGKQRATVYVSEAVVSEIWEELKQVARESLAEPDEEEGEEEEGTSPSKAAPPAKAAKTAPPARPATPTAPPPAPPAPAPTPAPDEDDEI